MPSATVVSTKSTARAPTKVTHTSQPLLEDEDEESVTSLIRSYIEIKHTEKPLDLRVTEAIAKSPKVIDSLAGRRSEYDGAFLTVAPMPSPLHEVVSRWFCRTCTHEMYLLLNETEEKWIEGGTMHRILPGRCDEDESSKKKEARRKYPDGAIIFVHPDSKESTPRVILETEFSETIEDLYSDMRQWLTKDDNVQLVILVKIDQDRKALTSHQRSEEFNDRLVDLVNQFGNEKAKNTLGSNVGHPTLPDKNAYKAIKDTIEIDDWVGPVTAFLEVWQRGGKNGYRRRGKKIVGCSHPQV